tara:strand:- start:333 stop:806 length:474 start_codon:yes stop_codon:yes gene_type:complete
MSDGPMIRYALSCPDDHTFESWFQSASAYDALADAGHVTCPFCGSAKVRKSLMAPAVSPARKAAAGNSDENGMGTQTGPLSRPDNARQEAVTAMRRALEANSDYVGGGFALEARRIHEGTAPERSIYGEAKPDEARKLLADGVPVIPLPFLPGRKTN